MLFWMPLVEVGEVNLPVSTQGINTSAFRRFQPSASEIRVFPVNSLHIAHHSYRKASEVSLGPCLARPPPAGPVPHQGEEGRRVEEGLRGEEGCRGEKGRRLWQASDRLRAALAVCQCCTS